jgi:hypothetical protein
MLEGFNTETVGSPEPSGTSTAYGDLTGSLTDEHAAAPEAGAPDATETPAPTDPAPEAAAAASTPAPAVPSEFAINRNGELIKVPAHDPRVQQWLSQGYDYAQRMAEFNRQQQELQARAKSYDERFATVDEFVRTPEGQQWWDHVQSQWQQRQAQDASNPIVRELSQLKEKLNEVDQFKNSVVEAQRAQQIAQEDQALESEIKSIREQYPDLDLDAVDPGTGKTLLQQVGEYAIKNGMRSFEPAFIAFNHKALVKREADKAREAAAKEIQAKKKAGLLGSSPTPTKGVGTPSGNLKNRSYQDLAMEGLSEWKASQG